MGLSMPVKHSQVVIIGAGVIGCSIAYHLANRGIASQVIERDSIAARASGKAWAVFAYPPRFFGVEGQLENGLFSAPPGSIRPFLEIFWIGYRQLADFSLMLKENGSIDIEYSELPWVRVALSETEEKYNRDLLQRMRQEGYFEGKWFEADDLRAAFPGISPNVRGGLLIPYLQVEPYKYTLGLAQVAEKMGAIFRQGEVVGFHTKGSRVSSIILASGTEIEADAIVLAVGPWTTRIASLLGKEIPVTISLTQCIQIYLPQQLPNFGLAFENAAIIPKINGSVILGTTGVPDIKQDFDCRLITHERAETLLGTVVNFLPSLGDARLVEHRGDLLAWSPTANHLKPLIGRFPEWENVYMATWMGAEGIALSLGVGQCMADLISDSAHVPTQTRELIEAMSYNMLTIE